MSTAAPTRYEFQAEIKQLLDIVVHSLYTEKEIFIRELVSNASDALEKLRHFQLTEKGLFDEKLPLEILLSTDETARTLTIQDFGVGMTRDELVQNLGTIAHSGSKTFLKALTEAGQKNSTLIGQFGVGFYSVFMVAKRVRVTSRTWRTEGEGWVWTSDGGGGFELEAAEGQRRGTKIVIELTDECSEFAKADRVREVIRRYSNFVQFPIQLNGERLNTVQAIWLRAKSEIKDEDYTEFYKFIGPAWDAPRFRLHFNADAPITINALLFVPKENPERFGFGREAPSVHLYCRKVLIDARPKDLLPEWMRFLKGVVDSEDLPLNISRELPQERALLDKLGRVLSKRFTKFLEEEAAQRAEGYREFYRHFSLYVKEGVATDAANREALGRLLRFESSLLPAGELTGLADTASRLKEGQKEIIYLVGPSRAALEAGPYLEAFRSRGQEVLLCTEHYDEIVFSHLREFEGRKLVSADQAEVTVDENTRPAGAPAPLPREEADALCRWVKETLGARAADVRVSQRLVDSPALVANADKFNSVHMRRILRQFRQAEGGEAAPVEVNFELNSAHPLVKQLAVLRATRPAVAALMAEQIFDNAMAVAGLLEDPREMVTRSYRLLEQLAQG